MNSACEAIVVGAGRMMRRALQSKLAVDDALVHEPIIGSLFRGRVETAKTRAGRPAIIRSISGGARITGLNIIFIDDPDPFAHGFVLK